MKKPKKQTIILISACLLLLICVCLFFTEIRNFLYLRRYEYTAPGYVDSFFAGKKVLFLVPHEDDDSNLAQGVMEAYAEAGSDVYVLFSTNGDHTHPAKTRIDEAALAAEANGIAADHLIFLGYGNDWDEEISGYKHIYDAPPDHPMTSAAGYTSTYGTEKHPAYRNTVSGEPSPYTKASYTNDVKTVLLDLKPDIIYCIDLDEHPDHRALSLIFESAMGEILKNPQNTYTPLVFKGFGYCTAWDGAAGYHGKIVPSTMNPADRSYAYNDDEDDNDYLPHARYYNWSERVRMPVSPKILSYSKRASNAHKTLSAYRSQNAIANFEKIVKADKVYWQRPTDSLLYHAKISPSSGEVLCLTDFKRYDTDDITGKDTLDNNIGLWVPDEKDEKKTISFMFDRPQTIDRLVFCENDSLSDHILSGTLSFSDGTIIETGEFRENGAPSIVETGHLTGITEFSFTIGESRGGRAGLTEIEAYCDDADADRENGLTDRTAFLKLTDRDGNYIYDYLYERGEELSFNLEYFSHPCAKMPEAFDVFLDGEKIKASCNKDEIKIENDFKPHTLTVSATDDGSLSDTVFLRPYTLRYRIMLPIVKWLETVRDRQ